MILRLRLWSTADGLSFSEPNIWLRSKVKNVATVQHWYFLHIFQSNTSVWLIISVFMSCEPICEPEITPVLYHLENLQKSKQKQFHVQCSVHKSYKTRKWTSLCIGNFEENLDLSRIYLAVQMPQQSWSTVCIIKESLHYTEFLPFLLHYLWFISKKFQFKSGAYLEWVLWVILRNRLLAPAILGHFSNVGKNCGC